MIGDIMKIEVFEIVSKEDKIYQELLEEYKTNPELKKLLDKTILPSEMVLAGDFRLIATMNYAIDMDSIKVYLVKDVHDDIFLWVIGKFVEDGQITMFPLLEKQSKDLQLAIRNALIEKGLMKKGIFDFLRKWKYKRMDYIGLSWGTQDVGYFYSLLN
jgi:hypothetical protein